MHAREGNAQTQNASIVCVCVCATHGHHTRSFRSNVHRRLKITYHKTDMNFPI